MFVLGVWIVRYEVGVVVSKVAPLAIALVLFFQRFPIGLPMKSSTNIYPDVFNDGMKLTSGLPSAPSLPFGCGAVMLLADRRNPPSMEKQSTEIMKQTLSFEVAASVIQIFSCKRIVNAFKSPIPAV
jgi:hypothetical protein